MFIPPGRAIHENMATSFVLLDALVSDLCEGGFSGIVAVTLRAGDYYVVLNRGTVTAATHKPDDALHSSVTVDQIATRARGERGRVSVYEYSCETAEAVAGRLAAEQLYAKLTTEFADLEKMINKLSRERDREWFIEINTQSGVRGLVHLKDGMTLTATGKGNGDRLLSLEQDSRLRDLVRECKLAGGVFDVYFTSAHAAPQPKEESVAMPEPLEASAGAKPVDTDLALKKPSTALPVTETPEEREPKLASLAAAAGIERPKVIPSEPPPPPTVEQDYIFTDSGAGLEPQISETLGELAPDATQSFDWAVSGEDDKVAEASSTQQAPPVPPTRLLRQEDAPAVPSVDSTPAESMEDVKRLMADIAGALEEASRPSESKDALSINLRVGQLKVAEKYPFLDPFRDEFEYHAGEIAFIGNATAQEFIEGLSEAMVFAVRNMVDLSAQPSRLKARIQSQLNQLIEKRRSEFEAVGLDRLIESLTRE